MKRLTHVELSLQGGDLASPLSCDEGSRKLLQDIINRILEAEMTGHLRSEDYYMLK